MKSNLHKELRGRRIQHALDRAAVALLVLFISYCIGYILVSLVRGFGLPH